MRNRDKSEDYSKQISSLSAEELIEKYVERDHYSEEYVDLLIKELNHRNISPEQAKEGRMQFYIQSRSDEELRVIYTDPEQDKKLQVLAKQEGIRRELNMDEWEKEKNILLIRNGMPGKYIVLGYILSIFGFGLLKLVGLSMALNYMFAKRYTHEGKFYKYNKFTRNAGKGMLIVFFILVILTIIYISNYY
jgi:hypothetical protein